MTTTMKLLIVFAATVSAITAGKMLGNKYADSQSADFSAHVEKNRTDLQRFEQSQQEGIARRQAEREAKIRALYPAE